MSTKSREDSNLVMASMEEPEANTTENNCYEMHNDDIVLSDHSLVPSTSYLSNLKPCELLRDINTSEEFLPKGRFNQNSLSVQDINSRYKLSRQPVSFQKVSLLDNSTSSPPPLLDNSASSPDVVKSVNNVQDLSFSVDLRSLNKNVQSNCNNYNYYLRAGNPDIYESDFTNEFSNNTFENAIPHSSTMFPHDDTASNYVLSENQPPDELLNSIDLNDHEKLLLSNEEMAILTQGKPGSSFELIFNNGEVLYAVIDFENNYNSTSPPLTEVSKDILSNRQCSVPVDIDPDLVEMSKPEYVSSTLSEPTFNPKSPSANGFSASSSTDNYSVMSTTLPEPITTSPISNNFDLCCNFSTSNSTDQFSTVIDTYSIVGNKPTSEYSEPLLQKPEDYSCSTEKKLSSIQTATDSKMVSDSQMERMSTFKMDYFPSAVNSIVVSETGKKYPKKYSFYSNNFSSFLNQDQTFEKDCRNSSSQLEKLCSVDERVNDKHELESSKDTFSNKVIVDENGKQEMVNEYERTSNVEMRMKPPVADSENIITLEDLDMEIDEDENQNTSNFEKSRNTVINVNSVKSTITNENVLNSKFLSSQVPTAVNSICDRAVQSRARATLPTAYLSINRIKSDNGTKTSTYGVFARKTIPCRTQFGPVEGVLIKTEKDEPLGDVNSKDMFQLTVESEDGTFLQLDVSNEECSNWMRFVRPATSYKEQNLIISQQGSYLYFTTIEVIRPKQELLAWYSMWYSQIRNYSLLSGDPCAEDTCKDVSKNDDVYPVPELNIDKSASTQNSDKDITICTEKDNFSPVSIVEENVNKDQSSNNDKNFDSNLSCNESPEVDQSSVKLNCTLPFKKQDKININKSLWLCTHCDLTFSNAPVMNLHILIHAADNAEGADVDAFAEIKTNDEETDKFVCPQCSQKFLEKKDLVSHVSKHGLKVQRWSDQNIDNTNSEQSSGEDEIMGEFEEKTYDCGLCKKKFKNPTRLDVHKRFHSDDLVLECPICETTFQKLAGMKEHVHKHAVDGVYTCPYCPKKYDRYKIIRKHIRASHSKTSFICKLCKKGFRSQYKLKTHMLRHSDKREFLCANCGKQFKRKDKLSEHMKKMHSEEKEKKRMEIINKKGKSLSKRLLKKKLPTKVLRLITENVNDYFYKCYICNIGFKRRGMLVNHINSFHPGVSLDTIPELNVPILKAYCNFYCLYCDKVYKSNAKRKAHIIKSHPGSKIPDNLERGSALNDPYAKHVGSVISNPFNCEFCYRQYASRAKLLSHHRKSHADLIPPAMKSPRGWNSQRKKRKTEKADDVLPNTGSSTISDQAPPESISNLQIQSVEFKIENAAEIDVNVNSQDVITLQDSAKDTTGDVNQQITSLTHLLSEELDNSSGTQEQYLKIMHSANGGITVAQTDENGENPILIESSSAALLEQILASYSFPNS